MASGVLTLWFNGTLSFVDDVLMPQIQHILVLSGPQCCLCALIILPSDPLSTEALSCCITGMLSFEFKSSKHMFDMATLLSF
jgi:hypothetical protein